MTQECSSLALQIHSQKELQLGHPSKGWEMASENTMLITPRRLSRTEDKSLEKSATDMRWENAGRLTGTSDHELWDTRQVGIPPLLDRLRWRVELLKWCPCGRASYPLLSTRVDSKVCQLWLLLSPSNMGERLLSGCAQALGCQQQDPQVLFSTKTVLLGFILPTSMQSLHPRKMFVFLFNLHITILIFQ